MSTPPANPPVPPPGASPHQFAAATINLQLGLLQVAIMVDSSGLAMAHTLSPDIPTPHRTAISAVMRTWGIKVEDGEISGQLTMPYRTWRTMYLAPESEPEAA